MTQLWVSFGIKSLRFWIQACTNGGGLAPGSTMARDTHGVITAESGLDQLRVRQGRSRGKRNRTDRDRAIPDEGYELECQFAVLLSRRDIEHSQPNKQEHTQNEQHMHGDERFHDRHIGGS